MSPTNKTSHPIWSTLLRFFVFIVALYLAYLILKPLLTILLGIGFWVIKFIVFIAVTVLVIHIFLKLIFKVDLLHSVFGRSWRY